MRQRICMRCDLLEIIITDAGPTNSSIFMSISKLAILAVIHIRIGGRNCARDLVRYKGWWNMSKRNLILSIICWVVLLITVVCWIVTYFGLFSMNQKQTMSYVVFFNINSPLLNGARLSELPDVFNEHFVKAADGTFINVYGWDAYGKLNEQLVKSISLFHLGYALITALSLAGGIAFTVLLVNKRKSKSLSNY